MYSITPILTTGQQGPDIKNLQEILLYLLETGIINNNNTGIPVSGLYNEMQQSFFGDVTTQFVELFKTQYFLSSPPNQVVDGPVAGALNGFASSQFPNPEIPITIRGVVTHTSGSPLPTTYTVRMEQVLFGGNNSVGTTTTDAAGNYSINVYASALNHDNSKVGFQAVVEVDISEEYSSRVAFYADVQEMIINVLINNDITISTEYDIIKAKIEAFIGSTDIESIDTSSTEGEDAQLSIIADSIEESVSNVTSMVNAFKTSVNLGIDEPELFYGMFRQRIPNEVEQLMFQPDDLMKSAITVSSDNNIIAEYDESDINTFIGQIRGGCITYWNDENSGDVEKTATFRIYNYVLGDENLTNEFIAIYFNFLPEDDTDFWTYLDSGFPAYDTYQKELKAVTVLAPLCGNNPALVFEMLDLLNGGTYSGSETLPVVTDDPQPSLLTILDTENWVDVIVAAKSGHASDFEYPDYVEGANDTARNDDYAERMFANLHNVFVTEALALDLDADGSTPFPDLKDSFSDFLGDNPGFDIRIASMLIMSDDTDTTYDFSSVSDKPAFLADMSVVQRLTTLSSSYAAMASMASGGLTSAFHVSRMGIDEFATAYSAVLGGTSAAQTVYSNAASITTHAVLNAYDYFFSIRNVDNWTGDFRNVFVYQGQEPIQISDPYAEWRALFGSLDGCDCCHCQSVYSPSAYLADTLHFLKTKTPTVHNTLVYNRRPEIKHIELTCDNSTVPLPYIDIVNEILEDIVGSGEYKMLARQTIAGAAEQRAVPEYINTESYTAKWTNPSYPYAVSNLTINTPYGKLKEASYPWTLPYNFYKRQIDTHLSIAGVKSHEMIQRFGSLNSLTCWDNLSFCTAYIGTSNEERTIITTAASSLSTPYTDLWLHYGFRQTHVSSGAFRTQIPDPKAKGTYVTVSTSTWMTVMTNRVDIFLQQTKLHYKDLLELLDCYFLNPFETAPTRKFAILNNSSTTNIATCNLYELKIDPANFNDDMPLFIDKVHRFVRLSRAIGWHYYDLDKALRAIGATDITEANFKKLVQIKYLSIILKMDVEEVCTLYRDIENLPYRDYGHTDDDCELVDIPSQYHRIFRNPALLNKIDDSYPFKDDATFSSISKEKFRNHISGIMELSAKDTDLILADVYSAYSIASTPFTPTLKMLSYLYRQVILLKALKVSVTDWQYYIKWITSSTYFGNDGAARPDAAHNTSAKPISIIDPTAGTYTAIPFDTLRFSTFLRLFKDSGFSRPEVEYILLDKPLDDISDNKLNAAFAQTLTGLRSELFKKWYSDFDASDENAAQQLEGIFSGILDDQDVKMLMSILNRVNDVTPSYTEAEYEFIDTTLRFFLPEGSADILADPLSVDYEDDLEVRYTYVYDNLVVYMMEFILKPAVSNFIAKEFKLDQSMVDLLLGRVIDLGGANGYDIFLNSDFVKGTDNLERWVNADDQFTVILLLHKASNIIGKFGLGLNDIRYFWAERLEASPSDPVIPDIPMLSDFPVRSANDTVFVPGTSSTLTFRLLKNLLQWMQVRGFTGEDISILFESLRTDSSAIIKNIASVFKMPEADAITLLDTPSVSSSDKGVLHIDPATDLSIPETFLRIIDCLEMQHYLPAAMLTLNNIADAALTADSQTDAADTIHLVKAPYGKKEWLQAIQPIHDILRVERRDALLSFMLAYPPSPYQYTWLTSNDVYETLMVDVEMMPVMQTTRILLAVNTIQIWIDRILLQLESPRLTPEVARQWHTWRRLYRLWEANRKIFLYPENYIEPELRDNKSPLFQELEQFLKQNEITKENVEFAYKTYLEGLDKVARLEIIGVCRESEQPYNSFSTVNTDVVHAFGRSKGSPNTYYYRKMENREWTAWSKMETEIDSEHFIPLMHRGRIRLYWLVFLKEPYGDSAAGLKSSEPFVTPAGARWKIRLAWTELKDGKWTAPEMTKDALEGGKIVEEMPVSYDHMHYYATHRWFEGRNWNKAGDLDKIKKEFINFYADFDNMGNVRFNVQQRYASIGQQHINGMAKNYRSSGTVAITTAWDEVENTLDQEPWNTNWVYLTLHGYFIVRFNGVDIAYRKGEDFIPRSIYFDHSWFYGSYIDVLDHDYRISNTDYWYHKQPDMGYNHYPDNDIALLRNAPGSYTQKGQPYIDSGGKVPNAKIVVRDKDKAKYLVFPRNLPEGYATAARLEIPYFFYKDARNTFFIEKINRDIYTAVAATGTVRAVTGTMVGVLGTTASVKASLSGSIGVALAGGISSVSASTTTATVFSSSTTFSSARAITGFPTVYKFHNFHHKNVDQFYDQLNKRGLDGLLDRAFISGIPDTMNFVGVYVPTGNVDTVYPHNMVDFEPDSPNSVYNWELFYHIPVLIANRLSQNQRFDEARTWYHYVFNPTNNDGSYSVKRYWNFQPFYNKATTIPTIDQVMRDPSLSAWVSAWANNPFKPHLVARTRPSAYMKNTVMKYLDNLIAWGDNLFRTDSREAINEATLLYILASQILGRRPEKIPQRAQPVVQTYATLDAAGINDFGNAMVKIENVLLSSGATSHSHKVYTGLYGPAGKSPIPSQPYPVTQVKYEPVYLTGNMFYFCTPENEKLLQYWDILADRLFKIRNSQSIDGVTRDLALFAPPIDPAILVKAAASGVSIADALGDLSAPLPSYRFNIIAQKATELVQEVKSLGSQLLSALEKKDAEIISLLRSSQEIKVLDSMTDLRKLQIDESKRQIEALQSQILISSARKDHYIKMLAGGWIPEEDENMQRMKRGVTLSTIQGYVSAFGQFMSLIPNFTIGPFSFGATFGGANLGMAAGVVASVIGVSANKNIMEAGMAATRAGYVRREQDWGLQVRMADAEISQINKQIVAAEVRTAMAEVELKNHELQMKNADEMDLAMRDKYTNEQLYDWLINQISFTYFQGYKLAFETAKKAERCFRYELNLDTSDYIQFGYWDSLHKGLMAGELLTFDIKRMEAAYLDKNKRQLEMTKNISIASLNPDALVALRINKVCEIELPEWLFDMDYPGQHMRRIKSVSISIPCVAGPYTSISCKLSQQSSKYRKNGFLTGGEYVETESDNRFTYMFGNIQSIATSTGQNDNGLFELNFRDERYLPFEGTGAISRWTIELPAAYAQFDYSTISDVILHVKFTAQDAGATRAKAIEYVQSIVKENTEGKGLYRLFDLKHEFSNEWHQLLNGTAPTLVLNSIKQRLPYMVQGFDSGDFSIINAEIFMDKDFTASISASATIPPDPSFTGAGTYGSIFRYTQSSISPAVDEAWHIHFDEVALNDVSECWMVIRYNIDY